MSWEKEEHRSRHVDFQCVGKKKSSNQLLSVQLPVEQIILNEHADAHREHLIEIPPDMVDQVDGIPQLNPAE